MSDIVKRIGNVVTRVASYLGCFMIYTRSNGYFVKDEFNGPEWQFGSDYLEMQKLYARIEKGENLTPEEAKELITRHCGLMHRASYLRSMYDSAMDVFDGRAEFRDE